MDITSRLRCDTARRYSVCDLSVYDVSGHQGTESLTSDDHLIVLMNSPGKLSVFWEGCKRLCDEVISGDLIYSPSGSTLSCDHREPVNSGFIKLKDVFFKQAAAGHVDYSRIDFTGRHIRQSTTTALAVALFSAGVAQTFFDWPMLIESTSASMAVGLISALSPSATTAFKSLPYGLSQFRKKRVMEYIDANISRHISLAELANEATVSQFHFSRLFKNATGMTVMEYIGRRRCELAKQMLRSTDASIAEVAFACGFSSQSHFTGVFKLDTGTTPAAYRRGIR